MSESYNQPRHVASNTIVGTPRRNNRRHTTWAWLDALRPIHRIARRPVDREREQIGPVVVPNRINVLELSAQATEVEFGVENLLARAGRTDEPRATDR